MGAPFADVTVGGGTEFQQLLDDYLNALAGTQGDRAQAAIALMNALTNAGQGEAGTLLGLLGELRAGRTGVIGPLLSDLLAYRQGSQANLTDVLGTLGSQRLGGADRLGGLLGEMVGSRLGGGALGADLLSQLQQGRLAGAGTGVDLYSTAAQERAGRGGLAQNLFGTLLNAELESRRTPLSFVDQVGLAGQFGTLLPFSQAGSEELTKAGLPAGTLTADVQRALQGFINEDPRLTALFDQTRGLLGQTQQEYTLAEAIRQAMQGTGAEASVAQQIARMAQPGGDENAILQAMRGGTALDPREQELIERLMNQQQFAEPGSLEYDLVQRIIAAAQPTETGNLADIVQGYAQGAVPQATVMAVSVRADGDYDVRVRTPSGNIELVRVKPGSGTMTVNGHEGPFTLSLDDVENYLRFGGQQFFEEPARTAERTGAAPAPTRTATPVQRVPIRQRTTGSTTADRLLLAESQQGTTGGVSSIDALKQLWREQGLIP